VSDAAAIDALLRGVHLVAVIVWMGHNWANVVQRPRWTPPPPAAAGELALAASKREHGIFRHASLLALAAGLAMSARRGDLLDALSLSGPAWGVGLGMWIGAAMTANLWFVLWPHQKKVLGFISASDEERVRCARVTFISSRVNTVLSFLALGLMVAAAHAPSLFG
jgi:hypothetical protein